MTGTDRYYAHLSACIICQRQQAPTGSSRYRYGFRTFLDWGAEFWQRLQKLKKESA